MDFIKKVNIPRWSHDLMKLCMKGVDDFNKSWIKQVLFDYEWMYCELLLYCAWTNNIPVAEFIDNIDSIWPGEATRMIDFALYKQNYKIAIWCLGHLREDHLPSYSERILYRCWTAGETDMIETLIAKDLIFPIVDKLCLDICNDIDLAKKLMVKGIEFNINDEDLKQELLYNGLAT